MDFQTLFRRGMKREIPPLLDGPAGPSFDLGASGKFVAPGATPLGLPDWNFPRDRIPADDGSVAVLHAYHFLEHLPSTTAILLLREAERVLVVGGVLNFSIPYYSSVLAIQDLTHHSFWCEETFNILFNIDPLYGYDPAGSRGMSGGTDAPWRLRVHFLIIAGIVSRNMALVGQIVKL